ncbi:MAG TPA: acyltransferase [Candidatus Sulfotelmatobacter sp.]
MDYNRSNRFARDYTLPGGGPFTQPRRTSRSRHHFGDYGSRCPARTPLDSSEAGDLYSCFGLHRREGILHSLWFLITSLLLKELGQRGTLSLRTFYWRRTLRIFPAMYGFLIAIGAGYVIGVVHIGDDNPSRFFSCAAYLSDYIPVWGWPLHHTWSLSVEEQFYLLWPVGLLLCGLRKAGIFPAILILIALITRTIAYGEYRFDTVADSLAIGCLASIYREPIQKAILRLWPSSTPLSGLLVVPLLLLPAANRYSRHPMFSSLVGIPLLNVSIAIAMLAVIARPPVWLNAMPVVSLGRLSYSLYLWHLPWARDFRLGWLWLPAALLCAWLSYHFIERPAPPLARSLLAVRNPSFRQRRP